MPPSKLLFEFIGCLPTHRRTRLERQNTTLLEMFWDPGIWRTPAHDRLVLLLSCFARGLTGAQKDTCRDI